MKSFILLIAATLISISTNPAKAAAQAVLSCSTPGDALSLLQVNPNGTVTIQVGEEDNAPILTYNIKMGLKDVQAGTSATVIAGLSGAQSFGGATDQSILLRVLDGQKSAYLAMNGSVYTLRCFTSP